MASKEMILSHLIDYKPDQTDMDFRCGNSKFSDDIWDFQGFIEAPHWHRKHFQLDFTHWNKHPNMKTTIKWYIVSELMTVKFNSVLRKLCGFSRLRMFLDETRLEIESFKDFSLPTVRAYYEYLLNVKSVCGSPLKGHSIRVAAQVLKELLIRGATRGWNVPANTAQVALLHEEMIIRNPRVKKEIKFGQTKKALPEKETVDKILKIAQETDDVIVGASIILSTQLGLRINEFITIEEGCLKLIDCDMKIEVPSRKTRKETVKRLLPANELVVKAVTRLEDYTRELRKASRLPYLFLIKHNNVIKFASYCNWTKSRLKPFIRRYDIREREKLVELTSHSFRHIFATYAIKSGMKVQDVAEILDHATIRMTETYSHIKEEILQRFAQVFSAGNALAGKRVMRLKEQLSANNPFKGRTVEEVDKLRKAMKINVLSNGLCLHHPMRYEPCEGDGACFGCTNFITTAEFLQVHQTQLAKVMKELEQTTEGPYAEKLRNQKEYLQDIIAQMESQLA